MADESLQAEVERLRAEVESYRQRELADLRSALIAAREEAIAQNAQSKHNADMARQVLATAQAEIAKLRAQLEAQRLVKAGRANANVN